MRFGLLLVVILWAASAGAGAVSLEDIKEWSVVVAGDATPAEKYAAEEFRSLFKQAAGVDLPLVASPGRSGFSSRFATPMMPRSMSVWLQGTCCT